MIVRTQRENESLIGRIFGSTSKRFATKQFAESDFLDEERFQLELLKEIYRSDRRPNGRDVGLIRVIFQGPDRNRSEIPNQIMTSFRKRLRVTDTIGWYDSSLAFLLPETDKDGTLRVANAIAAIAASQNLNVDTEVSMYPWDDELVALSDEIKQLIQSENDASDQDFPQNGDDSTTGSGHGVFEPIQDDRPDDELSLCEKTNNVVESRHAFIKVLPTPWWKRAVDIICSGAGILLLSPLFISAAIAIKVTSSGPVFFLQMREGKNGKPFGIFKFRTMDQDAEAKQAELRNVSEQDGPAFKLTDDPRVTPIGKYLRKSCVDELPQLFNVLLGQMSLVGPRPLPIGESHACTAWQRSRLTVLPGLTCTWQAHGGRDVKFAQWMRMDLEYIERRSFWFDLKLIVETAWIAIMHRGSV